MRSRLLANEEISYVMMSCDGDLRCPGRVPVTGTQLSSRLMTKHSKNNTASSIFSYAERKKLDYGTKGVRVLHYR